MCELNCLYLRASGFRDHSSVCVGEAGECVSVIMRRLGAACNFPALCGNVSVTGECLEDKESSVRPPV